MGSDAARYAVLLTKVRIPGQARDDDGGEDREARAYFFLFLRAAYFASRNAFFSASVRTET